VYFDEYRVFNADCATDEDCAMTLGYYHAAERFVQMDVRRRFSTGRLADILLPGLAALYVDDFADIRATFSTRDGEPLEEVSIQHASEKTMRLFEAYSAGVNKWLAEVRNGDPGAVFPHEFSHPLLDYGPEDVPDWEPSDCIASIIALIDSLTNEATTEVRGGVARLEIGNDAKFSDLWSRRPLEESSILPPVGALAATLSNGGVAVPPMLRRAPRGNLAALRRLSEKLGRIDHLRRMLIGAGVMGENIGSNNWVLDESRTSNGNALLSNDPHLGMSQPATWYLAHLDARTHGDGEFHSAGVTFAGLPWVLIGQNENVAWGLTTANMDFTDVYEEEVIDGSGVRFKGEVVPFKRVPWTVTFSDETTEEKELIFVPHHGPVMGAVQDDVAYTLRWTGHDISTDINFLTKLNAAATLEEARVALQDMTTVGQNVVVVDTAGEIGWFPYSHLPKRTWATDLDGDAPPWLPLDGRGDYEWDEYFTLEELPQATNPASGYIATANNDMTGALFDGDPTSNGPPFQVTAAAGFRHKRIVDLIDDGENQHSVATMDALISDVYSLIGERMRPGIMAIVEHQDTPDLSLDALKVVSALESWTFTCPTGLAGPYTNSDLVSNTAELVESSGCTAFHALLNELRFQIEHNKDAPSSFDPEERNPTFATYYSIVDPNELVAGDIYWDNPDTMAEETKYEVMARALNDVGERLDQEYGLGPVETKWAWGRLHGLILQSDLGSFLGPNYDNPAPADPFSAFANDGGLYTVDVAAPNPTGPSRGADLAEFTQSWGASTRFVCEALPEGPKCTIQLPGGQSGILDSPNYDDLLFPYLRNEPMLLVFNIDEAAKNAVDTVTFQ
jgi:penicillin amidase